MTTRPAPMLARIRRTTALPTFAEIELQRGRTSEPLFCVDAEGRKWTAVWRRERWKRFSEYEDSAVRYRHSFCWILDDAGERPGALEFAEYEVGPFESNQSFFDVLDSS